MKKGLIIGLACLCIAPAAMAEAPSKASIDKLLKVMHSQQLVESMQSQIEQSSRQAMQAALKGEKPSAAEQKAIDDMQDQMMAVIQDSTKWSDMRPMFVKIYQQSFDQHEVDGMTKFYSSDVGQSVVKKMPNVMHQTTEIMQQKVQAMMPRIVAIQKRFQQRMKTIHAQSDDGAS
ncbi:DUF2059 domain-containing protein [Salinisphaera sp. Q1T1-3]|uniref:DUF2059 domain-containing protein n=1 Tax=Salinisphaera sp. Q1T1-3 TaxID=2321229 RepID=UPI000E76B6D2|nr:DUF2059 domain-containing protein [Salinisphaera sp. Q1T1-3]RJS94799.1 DUF2059 domain-containing protein [Salinisphaera sp. Q1T1-3]